MRRGLQELTDAKLVTLKTEYETASEHQEQFVTALDRLSKSLDGLQQRGHALLPGLERSWFEGDSPLKQASSEARTVLNDLFERIDGFCADTAERVSSAVERLEALYADSTNLFRAFSEDYDKRMSELSDDERRLLDSHRSVTKKTKALPRL